MDLFFFRLNSYKCITDTLQELVNQSKAAPQSPSVPKKPGPPVLSSDPNMLSNEEAGHHVRGRMERMHSGSGVCWKGSTAKGRALTLTLDLFSHQKFGGDVLYLARAPLTILIFTVLFILV